VNAEIDETAIIRNTGDAISLIASGIDWKRGDRVVIPAVEYPSNVYPWMDACERHGVELVKVEERVDERGIARVEEAELIRACEHHRTKLLAVSHVQWASGQRMDVSRLGTFCRDKGILLAVDAIQSLGVVPLDVRAANVDFVFSGGHKWLMAPPGAGLLYCKRELIERVNPPTVGWLSVINPYRWELNFTRKTDASKFEVGTHAFPCIVGLRASLELMLSIGIGAIHAQVKALGDRFASGAAAKGYVIASDRSGEVSGAVCFTSPTFAPAELVKRMRDEHRIELAARAGRMRFAPHFYNTLEQVDRLIAALPGH
jgi:selenocysteine lyase/cysteine desulfurase